MAFTRLNTPQPVSKLGECIASIYHVSQGNSLEQFKQLCFNLIHQFVPLGESYWIIEHAALSNDVFCFACANENSQYALLPTKQSNYAGFDKIIHHIKMNQCDIQHSFYLTPENATHGFTPENQLDLGYILTHIVEAYRLNTLSIFQKSWHKYPQGNAIFDQEGGVIECDDNFKQLGLSPETILACHQQHFIVKDNLLFEVQKIIDTYFIRVVNFSDDFLSLSNKEKEVCFFLIQSYSNKDMADRLQVSVKTIENHLASIYQKTNITSRSKLTSVLFNFN